MVLINKEWATGLCDPLVLERRGLPLPFSKLDGSDNKAASLLSKLRGQSLKHDLESHLPLVVPYSCDAVQYGGRACKGHRFAAAHKTGSQSKPESTVPLRMRVRPSGA